MDSIFEDAGRVLDTLDRLKRVEKMHDLLHKRQQSCYANEIEYYAMMLDQLHALAALLRQDVELFVRDRDFRAQYRADFATATTGIVAEARKFGENHA